VKDLLVKELRMIRSPEVLYSVNNPSFLSRYLASMLSTTPRMDYSVRFVSTVHRADTRFGFWIADQKSKAQLCILFADESSEHIIGDIPRETAALGSFLPRLGHQGEHILMLNVFTGFQHSPEEFDTPRLADYVETDVKCRLITDLEFQQRFWIGNELRYVDVGRKVRSLVRPDDLSLPRLVGSVRNMLDVVFSMLRNGRDYEAFGHGLYHTMRHIRNVLPSEFGSQTSLVRDDQALLPVTTSWHLGPAPVPNPVVPDQLLMLRLHCPDMLARPRGQRQLSAFFDDTPEARRRRLATGVGNRYFCSF